MAKRESGPVQRFIGTLIMSFFGLGLLGGAFYLLWTNEGRVDLSKIARRSVVLNADGSNAASLHGQSDLVALTTELTADELLGDPPYLKPGPYLKVDRLAQMYAWEEDEDEDEDTGVTSYSYSRVWTSSPQNSAAFNNPTGHYNPPMEVQERFQSVPTVQAGAFSFDTQNVFLMHPQRLTLNREMTVDNRRIEENYIYLGEGSLDDPIIGDIRLWYEVYPANRQGTVFGAINGSRLETYRHNDGETIIFRAYQMDRESAVQDMRREFLTNLWGTRLAGTAMMWFGLLLILGPINFILGHIPILGRFGRFLIAIFTLGIALVLSTITIFVSALFHNLLFLIILAIIAAGTGLIFWRWQRREQAFGR